MCENKDGKCKQTGNVTTPGVALAGRHVCAPRGKGCPLGEHRARPSQLPRAAPKSGFVPGRHYVKQRWNVSAVYVKQQMVELHNLKCYMYTYISTSLR